MILSAHQKRCTRMVRVKTGFPMLCSIFTCALCATALGLGAPAHGQALNSGIPFSQIQGGMVQPRHNSPVKQFDAFRGAGLDGPRMPGMGVRSVAPFIPRLRQHRDAGPLPITPLIGLDRAPGDMPYRNDHVRLPKGELEALRRSKRWVKPAVGYASPGDTVEAFGQGAFRSPEFYVRAFGRFAEAGNSFEDGNGNDVPFEYERNAQQLILGWTPDPSFELFGTFLRDEIDDDRTPSANLDNVETDRLVGRLGFEDRKGVGAFDRVRGEIRYRDSERRNNNFDVRGFTFQPGTRRVEVNNERRFLDGRVFGDVIGGTVDHRLGFDWVIEERDGVRTTDSVPSVADPQRDIVSAQLFPDIAIFEGGPTWEGAYSVSENDHLRAGLGYRFVSADASDADDAGEGVFATLAPGVIATPRNAYDYYYGETDIHQTDHLFNARLLYQREYADDRLTFFGEVARVDRAADSKERYWGALTPPAQASNRLVGNPGLDPERHYQAAVGFVFDGPDWKAFGRTKRTGQTIQTGAWNISGAVRMSHVNDFITRDRARLQSGVLQNDGALIFRNVDANLVTAEADAKWNVTRNISAGANLIYTFAENTSDDRPLYGIAPLEANLLLQYGDRLGTAGEWSVGGKLRLVADQNRVDDNPATGAGFDEGETESFAVLDLYAGLQIMNRAALRIGIENVLDAAYQEHVARDTVDSIQRNRINAPGRSVFVRGLVTF